MNSELVLARKKEKKLRCDVNKSLYTLCSLAVNSSNQCLSLKVELTKVCSACLESAFHLICFMMGIIMGFVLISGMLVYSTKIVKLWNPITIDYMQAYHRVFTVFEELKKKIV